LGLRRPDPVLCPTGPTGRAHFGDLKNRNTGNITRSWIQVSGHARTSLILAIAGHLQKPSSGPPAPTLTTTPQGLRRQDREAHPADDQTVQVGRLDAETVER
jgi:hypothetical protein